MRPSNLRSIDDLLDVVLLEMATSHPAIPVVQEAALKQSLLNIMADEAGWQRDPWGMKERIDRVVQDFPASRSANDE